MPRAINPHRARPPFRRGNARDFGMGVDTQRCPRTASKRLPVGVGAPFGAVANDLQFAQHARVIVLSRTQRPFVT